MQGSSPEQGSALIGLSTALRVAEVSVDGLDRFIHVLRERLVSLRQSMQAGQVDVEWVHAATRELEQRVEEIRGRVLDSLRFDLEVLRDPTVDNEAAEVGELYLAGKLGDQLL